ncbi:uncharacterized protein TNCV_4431921 [Trichonephila clavipes]|nr:uncharacterized protein TNCV_4431921 [Trichonephila clavipes]
MDADHIHRCPALKSSSLGDLYWQARDLLALASEPRISPARVNINVALFSYTRAFGDGPRNLNHGQVTWTTPELAPPLITTIPRQREDASALDRFSVHLCPTRRVFSGTGLGLVTKPQPRYLYHSVTAASQGRSRVIDSRPGVVEETPCTVADAL